MKNKIFQFSIVFFLAIWIFFSCKDEKYEGDYNPENIKAYKNESSTLNNKMDSVEAVNFITRQKLIELYELSALASNTSNDTAVDSMLKEQLLTYFPKKDTAEVFALLKDLSNKKVKYVSITKFEIQSNDSLPSDSIRQVAYTVNYFNFDKKLVETNNNLGSFVLKKEPIKFKREFKFYFTKINEKTDSIQKDTISSGVIHRSKGKSPE